jgi:hypothetical protein
MSIDSLATLNQPVVDADTQRAYENGEKFVAQAYEYFRTNSIDPLGPFGIPEDFRKNVAPLLPHGRKETNFFLDGFDEAAREVDGQYHFVKYGPLYHAVIECGEVPDLLPTELAAKLRGLEPGVDTGYVCGLRDCFKMRRLGRVLYALFVGAPDYSSTRLARWTRKQQRALEGLRVRLEQRSFNSPRPGPQLSTDSGSL